MRFPAHGIFICGMLAALPAQAGTITPATPADRPMPDYPANAANAGGHVVIQFAIGPDGHTKNLHVAQSDPAGLFDQAALTAVSSWLYHPRTQNGRPVAQDANAVNLTFEPPAPEPSYKPEAFYTRAQYEAHQEGSATIAFDITPAGLTTNLAVVKSNPPGVFDKNALESVRTWQYAPAPPDKPYPRQTAEIAFKLAEAMLPPIPQSRHALEYPAAAADAGIMGNCIVGYWIEPDGTTSDVHIISCTPSGFFEDATLKYARNATYRIEADPRLNRRRYHCISVKFRFPGVARSDMSYLKPGEWIKLRFTRTTAGRARNIEVIGQSSPDVPTRKAIEQLRETTLTPAIENGHPIEQPNSIITISGQLN
jgi:TonB family protein